MAKNNKSSDCFLSMTGYGRKKITTKKWTILCELKSVNHKSLDIKMRLPKEFFSLEYVFIQEIKKHVARGRFDVAFEIEEASNSLKKVVFDTKSANSIVESLIKFGKKSKGIESRLSIADFLSFRELFLFKDNNLAFKQIEPLAKKALIAALNDLIETRKEEGRSIYEALLASIEDCEKYVQKIQSRTMGMAKKYFSNLLLKMQELTSQSGVDESRVAQEAAILADKSDITEEINRLFAHISHFDKICQTKSVKGRKLDFLCQEMFREANTIGSKSNDTQALHFVVDLKSEIEKLREQLQNIE
ncbi:YicC family protein [Sulfobacillus acidophilus]|uniref:YicC family protein n=1 Tax=Sulfobacillus acidophilus TaxID=53633 RepID=A0ABS3AW16_9FIRM|nr:YicC family protein [Sulfobacillus acidophilus]